MNPARLTSMFLAIMILGGAACGASVSPSAAAYTTITSQELQSQMNGGEKLTIIDLREPDLYRAGHIPGAKNIPFEEFKDRMKELSPEAKIALVCHSGPMGDISGALLAEGGFTRVSNLKGGMTSWSGKLEK